MEELKVSLNLNSSIQHNLLYPLLFRESIYALSHADVLNRTRLFLLENVGSNNKFSFLIVKRLITRLYRQNHLICFSNDSKQNCFFGHKKNLDSEMLSAGFTIIMEMPYSLELGSYLQGKEVVKSHNFHSIHSIFPFLEDKVSHFNYVLDVLIPYPIHLEILIQVLRYSVKESSSLHLLRCFLYEYSKLKSLITPKGSLSLLNPRFCLFLYNSYVCEHESIFVFLRNQTSHLRSTAYGPFLERIHFYGKLNRLGAFFANDFQIKVWLVKDPFIHFVRYQRKLILFSKDTSLLMNKWKFYFVQLWQSYFSMWSQSGRVRIRINQLSKNSFDLMGYLSSMRCHSLVIRSQMLEDSFLVDNAIKKLETRIPIRSLVGALSKLQFCTALGHPVSKPNWIASPDASILDRFVRISKNISHYYSGSSKKKHLYRIQYILRSSCVKTLARKHKSTVRSFSKRVGSSFLEELLPEEEQVLSLIFPKAYSTSQKFYKGPIWYLDILSVNVLTNYE
uniref:Maturase K n=2 Tax=Helianthemum nummularium subsp. obscurum TaxID=1211474 RepID=A0A286RV15_9ROSI|nr:maturase K [Helianthemum obscurum]